MGPIFLFVASIGELVDNNRYKNMVVVQRQGSTLLEMAGEGRKSQRQGRPDASTLTEPSTSSEPDDDDYDDDDLESSHSDEKNESEREDDVVNVRVGWHPLAVKPCPYRFRFTQEHLAQWPRGRRVDGRKSADKHYGTYEAVEEMETKEKGVGGVAAAALLDLAKLVHLSNGSSNEEQNKIGCRQDGAGDEHKNGEKIVAGRKRMASREEGPEPFNFVGGALMPVCPVVTCAPQQYAVRRNKKSRDVYHLCPTYVSVADIGMCSSSDTPKYNLADIGRVAL